MKKIKSESQSVKCIHCEPGQAMKNGKNLIGEQRYKCTNPNCGKTFTLRSIDHPQIHREKRMAAHLLLLGYSSREIANVLKSKQSIVDNWQTKYLPKLDDLNGARGIRDINLAYTYVSALDKGKRPERVNRNYSSNKKFGIKKTTRKKD